MFYARFDTAEEIAAIDRFEDELAQQTPAMLADVGRLMAERARRDFQTKARGGRGEDGVSWPPLTPVVQQRKRRRGLSPLIAVGTGELGAQANIQATVKGASVAVEFVDRPNADFINATRPLLPERMPDRWYREAEHIVQERIDHITPF